MKISKPFPIIILMLALLLASCAAPQPTAQAPVGPTSGAPVATQAATQPPASTSSEAVDLNVFAAASLTEPFTEIGKLFDGIKRVRD